MTKPNDIPTATGVSGSTTVLVNDGGAIKLAPISSIATEVAPLADGDYGDISVAGSTWSIDVGAVTYSRIQDVSATDTILGRATAGAGTIEEITCTPFARSLLDDVSAAAMRTTLNVDESGFATYTVTEGDVTAHQAALIITESQISDLGPYQPLNTILTNTTASFTTAQATRLGQLDASDNVVFNSVNIASGASGITFDSNGFVGTLDVNTLGGNRNWSLPNSSGTIVTTSGLATLTNKTITSASNTLTIDIGDLDTTGTANSTTFLRGDGSWQPLGGVTQLSELSDVDNTVSTPSEGDILVYRTAGNDWILEAKPISGANPAISDISDITITTVADNEVLAYDSISGEWINQTPTEAGLATSAQGTLADSALQSFALDGTPDTDGTSSGFSTNSINAGATISAFQLCYLASDGEWALADANASATATGMLSVALEAGTDTNPLEVALAGSFVRNDTWAWTVGGILYVSGTTGGITQTAPSVTGDIVRVIGYAVNADVIYFNPDGVWVEVS